MEKQKKEKSDIALKDLRDDSVRKIRNAVENGLSFKDACSLVEISDVEIRDAVVSDALKLLVSEMHYGKGVPLKQLALKLRLSLSCLMNAKESIREGEVIAPAGSGGCTRGNLGIA